MRTFFSLIKTKFLCENDATLMRALKRELFEELGYDIEKGINNAEIIKKNVSDHIIKNMKNSKIDYVSITQESSLEDLQTIKDSALLSIALHLGKTRLIDNLILSKKLCLQNILIKKFLNYKSNYNSSKLKWSNCKKMVKLAL